MYGFQSPPDLTALTECAGCHQPFRGREGGWHESGLLWHTGCRDWSTVRSAPYGHLEQPLRKLWKRVEPGPARNEITALGNWLTQARKRWPLHAKDWLSQLRPRLDHLRGLLRSQGIDDAGL